MDKAAVTNSLFGGENLIEVATPEIVSAPSWSDLDRLNRERELVGIYLSAHPLDEYAVILDKVCSVKMDALKDLTPLQNQELTMGGIVVSVREMYTKKGNPCGFARVEDYSGSFEFPFFGSDWMEKKSYFSPGMFLYIKGKCQPKQWRQGEWEVKVNSVELLPEIKERLIEKITVSFPLSALDDELIEEFLTLVEENPGNAELRFYIQDEDGQNISLTSKKFKIEVNRKIVAFLDNQSLLSYKIN